MESTKVYAKHDVLAGLKTKSGEKRFKYIIHTGSSRSSKTTSILQWIDEYCENNPNTRATVWRDTRASLGSTVWSDFRKLFGEKHEFAKQTTSIYYRNRSSFEPHGGDSTNAHGLTQDIAWLNEPYKISKEIFDQIDQRTSELIIIDWNPKQGHWIDTLAKNPRAIVIHSTYKDNPFCPKEQRIKIESYQPVVFSWVADQIGENEALHYDIESNPNQFEEKHLAELARCIDNENENNGTADEYMWQVYGLGIKAEKPNKIYHKWRFDLSIERFEEVDAQKFYGIDFGSNSPASINQHKFDIDTLYTDQMYYSPIKGDNDYADILERLGVSKDAVIICDSAQPVTIATLRRRGYKRAVGANKAKGSVMQGIKFMQSVRHRVTSRSKDIKSEYDSYEWAVDRYDLPLDQPIKKDDHAMDEMRYVLFAIVFILKIDLASLSKVLK
jgi:phage terminase large subunit